MAFIETPRFPEDISFGATFGPGYSTDIVSTSSGFEQVNQNWDGSLMGGDVSHGVKTPAQMKTLNTFFRIAKGKANSFRFQDKLDYTVTLADADGYLGTGAVGTGLPSCTSTTRTRAALRTAGFRSLLAERCRSTETQLWLLKGRVLDKSRSVILLE